MGSMSSLMETLTDIGFGGLWRSCSLGAMEDADYKYLELTEKLIEVSRYYVTKYNTNKY